MPHNEDDLAISDSDRGGGHRNETRRNAAEFSNPETDYDVDLFPETGTSPI